MLNIGYANTNGKTIKTKRNIINILLANLAPGQNIEYVEHIEANDNTYIKNDIKCALIAQNKK